MHEITLILPELFPDNEGGDTDDNIKRESSGVGQCTKRLLLPNASRPNHNVFESAWKFKVTWMLGNRIYSIMQTSQTSQLPACQYIKAHGPLMVERICGTDFPELSQQGYASSLSTAWRSHEQQDSSEDRSD
jgi:hypothetical protein